jgi:hypothetical protein
MLTKEIYSPICPGIMSLELVPLAPLAAFDNSIRVHRRQSSRFPVFKTRRRVNDSTIRIVMKQCCTEFRKDYASPHP